MPKPPEPGSTAPDFVLPGLLLGGDTAERREYRLADAKGGPLVLVFYPGDDTTVCTKQLCSYTSDLDRFKELGATVWGVSPQDLDSHESFARKHRLAFPLLADADRAVAKAYGIAVPGLGLRRSVFILDENGAVRWKHVALAGLTFQHSDTLAEQLAALKK
ncbi:peroxiredoxin [Kitasatospora sp. MAP5-34]|uniref:peroxiredoxin n=1 Tax=Kitasatospora sp. MAP5-34 TaxID=3035102 RepID=UPI002476648F|nr:peroxiredoxin [Kitasatospora sp. MAP5-34]MDH6579255.1 peroxiredoxin Q/BCP [Kitasatospora sp. MAP5-34]